MHNILLQLDPDPQPSSFDAVVARDAGAETLLRHGGVTPEDVRELIYGLIFTRHPDELRHSAVFIGGRDTAKAEALWQQARKAFFGPLRVSMLLDPNGANTTAAAAIVLAGVHLPLGQSTATVLGGTGPVGRRVARLLVRQGTHVTVVSRSADRAANAADELRALQPNAAVEAAEARSPHDIEPLIRGRQLVVAAGTTGVELLPESLWRAVAPKLVIDLNAVPPLGIGGIDAHDAAKKYGETLAYGAIGVGNFKMKIHRAAVRRLFTANDLLLDAEELAEIGRSLIAAG